MLWIHNNLQGTQTLSSILPIKKLNYCITNDSVLYVLSDCANLKCKKKTLFQGLFHIHYNAISSYITEHGLLSEQLGREEDDKALFKFDFLAILNEFSQFLAQNVDALLRKNGLR